MVAEVSSVGTCIAHQFIEADVGRIRVRAEENEDGNLEVCMAKSSPFPLRVVSMHRMNPLLPVFHDYEFL